MRECAFSGPAQSRPTRSTRPAPLCAPHSSAGSYTGRGRAGSVSRAASTPWFLNCHGDAGRVFAERLAEKLVQSGVASIAARSRSVRTRRQAWPALIVICRQLELAIVTHLTRVQSQAGASFVRELYCSTAIDKQAPSAGAQRVTKGQQEAAERGPSPAGSHEPCRTSAELGARNNGEWAGKRVPRAHLTVRGATRDAQVRRTGGGEWRPVRPQKGGAGSRSRLLTLTHSLTPSGTFTFTALTPTPSADFESLWPPCSRRSPTPQPRS